jgi:hypothetical protein
MRNNHCCQSMSDAIDSNESSIVFVPKFREYGIKIIDGGSSYLEINFCSWCGSKLPDSLRDDWFDRLERLNIDPAINTILEDFLNDRWYSKIENG